MRKKAGAIVLFGRSHRFAKFEDELAERPPPRRLEDWSSTSEDGESGIPLFTWTMSDVVPAWFRGLPALDPKVRECRNHRGDECKKKRSDRFNFGHIVLKPFDTLRLHIPSILEYTDLRSSFAVADLHMRKDF